MAHRSVLLAQVNRLRVALNQDPITEIRSGVPNETTMCPIAMSLRNGVTVEVDGETLRFDFRSHPLFQNVVKASKKSNRAGRKTLPAAEAKLGVAVREWENFARTVLKALKRSRFRVLEDDTFLECNWQPTYEDAYECYLVIECTPAMQDFVTRFDDNEIQDLIINRRQAQAQLNKLKKAV